MSRMLLNLLLPVSCSGCGRYGEGLCTRCRAMLPDKPVFFHLADLARGVALGDYEWPLREAILDFKFRHKKKLGMILAELLESRMRDLWKRPDLVVPVPMGRERLYERGYNHAAVLAGELAAKLGVPSLAALRLARSIPHQVGLGRPARRTNVLGAFLASAPDSVAGARIVLVDDVVTTGATLSECARVLKRCGAAEVSGACVAVDREG